MDPGISIVLGVAGIIAVATLSRRSGIAEPLLLVGIGVCVSFLPFVGEIKVNPELILAGVLPPLLYSSAVSLPAMGFRRNFRAIAGLSMVLVIATTLIVGFLLSRIVPGIDLPTAIALAAIISPTDAVATSIVKRLGVSPRIVTILDGESLLNDASALVVLRSAVAAMAGSISLGWVAVEFVWAVVAAAVIGLVVGKVSLLLAARLQDAVLVTAASFIVPFVAYIPAEHVGASGLVAAVIAGLIIGQGAPLYLQAQDRRTSAANWRTIELLLEGGVFLLMGLQLSGLMQDVRDEHGSEMTALWLSVVASLAVLIVRAAYLTPVIYSLGREHEKLGTQRNRSQQARIELEADAAKKRKKRGQLEESTADEIEAMWGRIRQFTDRQLADLDYFAAEPLGAREGALLVWAGLRGVVTVAAAQSLPENTPQRSLLVLIAFVVATGSLLIQGGSLPWLVRRLRLDARDRTPRQRQQLDLVEKLAEVGDQQCRDGLLSPEGVAYDAEAVAQACRQSARIADAIINSGEQYEQYRRARIQIIQVQRKELLKLRDEGAYPSALLEDVLTALDSEEISLSLRGVNFGRDV